jgi:hypothetical protein
VLPFCICSLYSVPINILTGSVATVTSCIRFKMRNFLLHLLFTAIVGILGDSGNDWQRNNVDRNVIGIMNEVIEKPEHVNEGIGRQKFKSAGTWHRSFSQNIFFTRCSANFRVYTKT